LNWGTDLPKALAQAKADKKMVLLDFTGSDWCG
jgi:thiol:disulfide interchange protein